MPTRNRTAQAAQDFNNFAMDANACPQPETYAQFQAAVQNFDVQRICRVLFPKSAYPKISQAVPELQNSDNTTIILTPDSPVIQNDMIAVISANADDPNHVARSPSETDLTPDEQTIIKSVAATAQKIAGLYYEDFNAIAPAKNLSADKVSLKFLIPSDIAGHCIGKGGETIGNLRRISGCEDVLIHRANCPNSTDRVMELAGSPAAVYDTLISVLIKMRCYAMQVPYTIENSYNPETTYPPETSFRDRKYGGYYTDDERVPSNSPHKRNRGSPSKGWRGDRIDFAGNIIEACQTVIESADPVAQGQTLRLLLQHYVGGRIIGKKGDTINHLRKFYEMEVKCRDSGTDDRILEMHSKNHSDNRQCIITALSAIMVGIAHDVNLAAESVGYEIRRDEGSTELRILVDARACGGVVGKGGENIKRLRRTHSCLVKTYNEACPNSSERVVAISGTPQNLLNCVYDVMGLINGHQDKPHENKTFRPIYSGDFDHTRSVDSCQTYGGFIMTYHNPSAPAKSPAPPAVGLGMETGRKRGFSAMNNNANMMPGWGAMPVQPQTMAQMFPQQAMAQQMMPQQTMPQQPMANMMSQVGQSPFHHFSSAPPATAQVQRSAPAAPAAPKQVKKHDPAWDNLDDTKSMAQAIGMTPEMYMQFKKKMMGEMVSNMMGGK